MPLYVVGTPIGNKDDLSPRALSIMKEASLILAEDTRKTSKLLASFGIEALSKIKRFDSLRERELCQDPKFIKQLKSDSILVLVCDAGSPCIADPGVELINLAHNEAIKIVPIPGASALTTAISISGFSADKFIFGGFMPRSSKERIKAIEQHKTLSSTVVFYEVPHRIQQSLGDLAEFWGASRRICIARELTKTYESIYRGSIARVYQELKATEVKGEMVLVLQGVTTDNNTERQATQEITEQEKNLLRLMMENNIPLRTASAILAKGFGKSKNLFYNYGIRNEER